ncbi:hypothetical protein BOMU111920_17260 [Bordetella muralis]
MIMAGFQPCEALPLYDIAQDNSKELSGPSSFGQCPVFPGLN